MYALPNKTQHKLIVKVRGGISSLDNFTSSSSNSKQNKSKSTPSPSSSLSFIKESGLDKHFEEAGFDGEINNLPRPIFYSNQSNGGKQKHSMPLYQRNHLKQQYITPEHNEMIKYVQQSWKGVEQDYRKSVSSYISNLDLNSPNERGSTSTLSSKQKHVGAKKKTATTSTPLLLSGSYHHTSGTKDSTSNRPDSFQPFDLEAFWGNRMFKRLTEEV